jgi:hypothetical protein
MTVFCRWNVLVRIKARALQLVGIVDQRSVLVQDLFHAEDDCRDLILEWRVSRGADHQAERAGARLAEAKERMLAISNVEKPESVQLPRARTFARSQERARGPQLR